MTEILSVPALAIICGVAAQWFKGFSWFPSAQIPTLCTALGMALGVVCFFTLPGYIPAENWLVAAAIGAVSGGYATTANQAYRLNKS